MERSLMECPSDEELIAASGPPICKCITILGEEECGKGVLLPLLGKTEHDWPNGLRVVLYLVGLLWCFMGVAIIADVFMAAIEKVTSKTKRIPVKGTGVGSVPQRFVTVKVWNDTVANLTLMALGSSAPEILLSVIEIISNNFYSGALGPSTIVGSAAFNLLVITAVCVISIDPGDYRKINDTSVFAVTASFSVFAYVWLVIILMMWSPEIVSVPEGIISFLMFPILVVIAFMADKGMFSSKEERAGVTSSRVVAAEMTKDELAEMAARVRHEHGSSITDTQVMRIIEEETSHHKSRAQYRVEETRKRLAMHRVSVVADQNTSVGATVGKLESGTAGEEAADKSAAISFGIYKYAVLESKPSVTLQVVRTGALDVSCQVKYKTRDGTAKAAQDYIQNEGTLTFKSGEIKHEIEVKIIDDAAYENDEDFFVDLSDPQNLSPAGGKTVVLGAEAMATVTIIDDDEPGIIVFEKEDVSLCESLEDSEVEIKVERKNGSTGTIGCSYTTKDGTAIMSCDYTHTEGKLEFKTGEMAQTITIPIKARGRYEGSESFSLILTEPTGGAKFDTNTDGGANSNICTLTITADASQKKAVDRMASVLHMNWDKAQIGHANWGDQFKEAFYCNGSPEEQKEASAQDWAMHIVTVPWKLLFAIVPPTDYFEGWLCFVSALIMIGGVTAVIGDMASLLGCTMGVPDTITAITFVALGTSLPDTFASRTAAKQDPYADASIGNVTGSNSVNVFLGLGLPWMIAAIYWNIQGPTAEWQSRNSAAADGYGCSVVKTYVNEGGGFVVVAGDLGFSVSVFVVCALLCIAHLLLRRKLYGGELGGPEGPKWGSAVLYVLLWFAYIILSSMKALGVM